MSMRPARSGAHVPALLRAVGRAYWNHSPLPASAAASQRLVPDHSGSAPRRPPSHPLASRPFLSLPPPAPLLLPALLRQPPARHLCTEGPAVGKAREQTAGTEAAAAEAEGGMAQGAGQEAEGRVGGEGSAQEEEWRRQAEEARERLLRAYADMENLRQRAQRDVDAARLFAVQVPPVQVPPVQAPPVQVPPVQVPPVHVPPVHVPPVQVPPVHVPPVQVPPVQCCVLAAQAVQSAS
ncbi:unnamed protein product, partial [Closterium sp. Naga37s-1]